jgi:predicted MFS family arabinose efflux permease
VILAKMIADWFVGKEIITAMAILASSWPLGISLGLISLGKIATVFSWRFVMVVTTGTSLIALVLVAALYRTPPALKSREEPGIAGIKFSWQEMRLVMLSGLIWALFNAGFIVLPSFATDLVTANGYTLAAAASMVSITTWIGIVSVQLGGYISEKINRPNIILVSCFIGIGIGMGLLPFFPYPMVVFIWLGFIFGPPAGIIMALPAGVLHPENRAAGMGLFYSCFYGAMMALTSLAGFSRDLTQNAAAPILFGGMLLILAIIILVIFRMSQARIKLISAD